MGGGDYSTLHIYFISLNCILETILDVCFMLCVLCHNKKTGGKKATALIRNS